MAEVDPALAVMARKRALDGLPDGLDVVVVVYEKRGRGYLAAYDHPHRPRAVEVVERAAKNLRASLGAELSEAMEAAHRWWEG